MCLPTLFGGPVCAVVLTHLAPIQHEEGRFALGPPNARTCSPDTDERLGADEGSVSAAVASSCRILQAHANIHCKNDKVTLDPMSWSVGNGAPTAE